MIDYWPSLQNINECIRTEAEELAEYTLLAVHQPVNLLRLDKDGNNLGHAKEEDLLNHFLQTPRPIPIVGKAGVGKSHIIRWLDAKLRLRKEYKDKKWHIVRIPKSASLREVLTSMLAGLEGEIFNEAREDINKVSEKRTPREIAEWLLMLMGQELRNLHERNKQDMEALKKQMAGSTPEQLIAIKPQAIRLQKIHVHAEDNALPTLINDAYFKQFLLKEEHCLYRLANRLTNGATSSDLDEGEQQLQAKDLDFSFNINDLSLPARQYIQKSRLNTHEDGRKDASEILNLVLVKATQALFNQLFNFRGRSFSDLFTQIRQALHEKQMTLMVLVEDMSLITAIEDVLIDSLEREGIRDGKEVLCPVCSAIAVTDGYQGYARRRQGMLDRAKGEWVIEEVGTGREETRLRIVDFCGRYINAARFGGEALRQRWEQSADKSHWPPDWEASANGDEMAEEFGRSEQGFSLFPFNTNAIHALAETFCRDDRNELKFNPRQIINQILLRVLQHCRRDADEGRFPPPHLGDVAAPAGLRSWLFRQGFADTERAESVVALWGYPADSDGTLASTLPPEVARSFGLDDLAQVLENTKSAPVHIQPVVPTRVTKVEPQIKKTVKSEPTTVKPKVIEDKDTLAIRALDAAVGDWMLKGATLEIDPARYIKSSLAFFFDKRVVAEWAGSTYRPTLWLGKSNFVAVELPNAQGNRGVHVVKFIPQAEYDKRSVQLTDAAMALARFGYYRENSLSKTEDWSYADGKTDYLIIQSFCDRWVNYALTELVKHKRNDLPLLLSEQIALADALGAIKTADGSKEVLARLLQNSKTLSVQFRSGITKAITELRAEALAKWDDAQDAWLSLVALNDHALEGDLLLSAIQKALKKRSKNTHAAVVKKSLSEIRPVLDNAALFADCENADDFSELVTGLATLVKSLGDSGDYPADISPDSSTLTDSLSALTEGGIWMTILKLRGINQSEDPLRQWQLLCELDGVLINRLMMTMQSWQQVHKRVLANITAYNHSHGGHQISEFRTQIESSLQELHQVLDAMQSVAGEQYDNA
ncbi:protein DpdH [Klebsiella sp. JB_Kp030]|uniref:protein DpdH n=1 Tax=Klebsiella TaxID=570 RepID=UPI0029DD7ED8|nr:protein DpdH [Klebsiella pneumoniae]MDX7914175.1 protein DpdH [Klebsiella pneumoniae]